MKHLLTAIIICLALSASAQSKKQEIKIDSVQKATDSTGLLQYRDYLELQKYLDEIPAKYANPIMNWFNEKFATRLKEFEAKKRKQ